MLEVLALLTLATPVAYFLVGVVGGGPVRHKLRDFRLIPVSVRYRPWAGNRQYSQYSFKAKTVDGEVVRGTAVKHRGKVVLDFDGEDPAVNALRRLVAKPEEMQVDEGADLETRVRFETNQRLERLRGDLDEFMSADLDGDGTVDDEELAVLRERIEAEVRAELTGEAPPTVFAPTPPEELSDVSNREEIAETDGHW